MKGVKNFFVKLSLLLIILVLIDLMAGLIFSFLLNQQKDGRFYKIQYSLKHAAEDIIILGSSRAEFNFNPAIFSEVLGKSCWNAGRGGMGILYSKIVEQEILNRYNPEMIILNIDPIALEGPNDYDLYAILRPFAKESPDIFNTLSKKDSLEKFKLLSNIYSYNSVMFYFLRSFFLDNKDGRNVDKGWKPRLGEISSSLIAHSRHKEKKGLKLNEEKVDILNASIEMAMQKNCKLVFVIAPDYFHLDEETPTLRYLKNTAKKYSIPVYDYTRDTALIEKQEYFCDVKHLNDIGASKFSEIVAQDILSDLKTGEASFSGLYNNGTDQAN